ncbi:DUF6607 family protein [Haliea atlantica]
MKLTPARPLAHRGIATLAHGATALLLGGTLLATSLTEPAADSTSDTERAAKQFTYAWPFTEDDAMRPRGGTSRGAELTLADAPSEAWLSLQEAGLDKRERDRRAILAMAGTYRASFDFLETVGYTPDFSPARPYQSWGTEHIYVVADRPDFISLQHIMVMRFRQPDGTVSEPMVMKHWRQDWRYEDRVINAYVGNHTWERRAFSEEAVDGTWSQAVFQVDDSPRYESIGRWVHTGSFSAWESETTWRPLPRREFSVRDDYQVLAGTNRHTITPSGWVQEEDNLKLVLGADGEPRDELPYLAREAGLARYELLSGFDVSAGDTYWTHTGAFWQLVREHWAQLLSEHEQLTLRSEVDGQRLFEVMFSYAEGLDGPEAFDRSAAENFVRETLARFTETRAP